jgi:hypothetical protein
MLEFYVGNNAEELKQLKDLFPWAVTFLVIVYIEKEKERRCRRPTRISYISN